MNDLISGRVLYVGPLDPGGTCRARMRALEELGVDVVPFDQRPHLRGSGRLVHIPWIGRFVGHTFNRSNRALLAAAAESRAGLIWVDKGYWVDPQTLRQLRDHGHMLIHHCTDCVSRPRDWRYYLSAGRIRSGMPIYHRCFTSNHFDVRFYQARGWKHVCLTQNGYDRDRFRPAAPVEARSGPAHDLLLVGHREDRTERMILALIRAGLNVRVYGAQWDEAKHANELKGHVETRRASDEEYVRLLQHARIGLCFPSVINRSETVGRSFETVACGTFLLALRTGEHSACFKEGEEAEFFSDEGELVAKARRYLKDDAGRRTVAANGLKRLRADGYSWQEIMVRDWHDMTTALNIQLT